MVGPSYAAVVSERASDVYDLEVRLGRWLPRAVVLPLAFARNFVVAFVTDGTSSDTSVAPQWVLIRRQTDGGLAGRVGSGPGESSAPVSISWRR